MNTEKKLKDRCTPAFIKWMVELAEGFEIIDEYYINFGKDITTPVMHIFASPIFPLLIHRSVEGYNKQNRIKLTAFNEIQTGMYCVKKLSLISDKIEYEFTDYKSSSLTQVECAMFHCLLDIFEEERK